MQILTDEMLKSEVGGNYLALVFVPLIILVIVLALLIRFYLLKRDARWRNRIIVTLILMVILVTLSPFIFRHFSSTDWYLSEAKIKDLYVERKAGEAGSNHMRYFVEVGSDEVMVYRGLYERLSIGDEVFVLNNESGDALMIYPKDDYRYEGNRLRIVN